MGERGSESPREGKRKGAQTILCVFVLKRAACVVVRPAASACVRILSRVFVGSVGADSLPFPLLERSGTGRLAGWLAAQERKQSLSNSRWSPACAYTAETHTRRHEGRRARKELRGDTVAFIGSVT